MAAAPYTVGGPTIPDSLAPIMQGVAQRLAMQRGNSQAADAFAPVMAQIQGQTVPPDALAPLPPDISDPKAALAIVLSNLGATLTAGSGLHNIPIDPNAAFNTIMARRGQIEGTKRENAKTQAAFAANKQAALTETATKQAETGVTLGSQELQRQQNETQFNRQMDFEKWKANTDAALRREEMQIQLQVAKINAGGDLNSQIAKALAMQQMQGLGADVGHVLASIGSQIAGGSTGKFQVYLPDPSAAADASAPTDPVTKMKMRLFTDRQQVETYMDGMISSLSPLIQNQVRKMWLNASAPLWKQLEGQQKEFQTAAEKQAAAAAAEKQRRKEQMAKVGRAVASAAPKGAAPGSVAQ